MRTEEWLTWADALDREMTAGEILEGLRLGAVSQDYAQSYIKTLVIRKGATAQSDTMTDS